MSNAYPLPNPGGGRGEGVLLNFHTLDLSRSAHDLLPPPSPEFFSQMHIVSLTKCKGRNALGREFKNLKKKKRKIIFFPTFLCDACVSMCARACLCALSVCFSHVS